MFGSVILDVAIGLSFVYLFLSLVGSTITEIVSSILKMRSKNLEEGIRAVLNDPAGKGIAKEFYNHPLIRGLARSGSKPSYIPPRTFALALLDTIAPSDPTKEPASFAQIRDQVKSMSGTYEGLQKTLLLFLDDAEKDIAKVRKNVEQWFDDAMNRAAGWYKRKSQLIILVYAFVIAMGLNVDTIAVSNSLYRDTALRSGLVAAAQQIATSPEEEPADATEKMLEIKAQLEEIQFPLGWKQNGRNTSPNDILDWIVKLLGWSITALAVSLGAPFWFDLLTRFVNIRSAGKKPEELKKT
jgi:hypothetical protein